MNFSRIREKHARFFFTNDMGLEVMFGPLLVNEMLIVPPERNLTGDTNENVYHKEFSFRLKLLYFKILIKNA